MVKKKSNVGSIFIGGMLLAFSICWVVIEVSETVEENKVTEYKLDYKCIQQGYDGVGKWNRKLIDTSNVSNDPIYRKIMEYDCIYIE